MEKIFHENRKEQRAGVAILISDKIDFKTKSTVRDKGHYTMIKVLPLFHQEDVTLVNIDAHNIRASK